MDDRSFDEREIEQQWISLRKDVQRRGVDPATAEDIVQEAWLRALTSRTPEDGRLRGWLHVVAGRLVAEVRRTSRNRAARERRSARVERIDAPVRDTPDLERLVEELDEPYRTVVRLRFFEDRGVSEIAVLLQRPEATVRTQLSRALERLGSRIETPHRDRSKKPLQGLLAWLGFRRGRSAAWRGVGALAAACALVLWTSVWLMDRGRAQDEIAREVGAQPLPPTEPDLRIADRATALSEIEKIATAVAEPSVPLLRGTVLDPDGAPLPGATVHAGSPDEGSPREVKVDDVGGYEIAARDADLVWASHPDWLDSPRCFVASARRLDELDLHIGRTGGRLAVRVTDHEGRPLAGARILVDPRRMEGQRLAPRGTLEFASRPRELTTADDGTAELLFPDRPSFELAVLRRGSPPWSQVLRSDVESPLSVALPAPGTLRGRIVDDDGHPAWNAHVEVFQLAGLVSLTATAATDGTFVVSGLGAGEFLVRCAEDLEPLALSARYEGVIAAAGTLDLPTLTLGKKHTLTGIVREGSRPVPHVEVLYEGLLGDALCETMPRRALTDAAGCFQFAGCRPQAVVWVSVMPEGDRPGIIASVAVGRKEAILQLTPSELAPLEVEFPPDEVPTLVELRGEPYLSILLAPTESPTRFRSPPLPSGKYGIIAWSSELGTWTAHKEILHRPESPLHVLEPIGFGELAVSIALPPGIEPADVQVSFRCDTFNAYAFAGSERMKGVRILPWDERQRAFVARVPQQSYALEARARGMAEIYAPVRVAGARTQLALQAVEGVECHLVFRSQRTPCFAEGMLVEMDTPAGTRRLYLFYDDQQAVLGGVRFTAHLALDVTRLRVLTQPRDMDKRIPMTGTRSIEPHELDATVALPVIEVKLEKVAENP